MNLHVLIYVHRLIQACGSTFEGLDEESNFIRNIPEGGSAETGK